MTEKNEALRLAVLGSFRGGLTLGEVQEAEDELRRLHEENESLRQIVQDFPPVEAELREVSDRAHRLEAQRDALLEALKQFAECELNEGNCASFEVANRRIRFVARAAIAKAEGEKK